MLQKRKQIQGPFKSFMKCAVKTVNNTQQGAGNVHFVQFQHDYRQETNVTWLVARHLVEMLNVLMNNGETWVEENDTVIEGEERR